ncbi:hypothetical protein Taro_036504 [Colocasia esculenta]|uniref:non-specific serine/threonine protein kinase n=1 Tax=Colocasia esculenta TaxID=4460 RepID=A0A843VXP8_COLES|nr:hypothetical protein [Colocasia esculenta]
MGLSLFSVSIYFLISSAHQLLCMADDMLVVGKPLFQNQTITSAGGTFELGFFSPANSSSTNRYVGIWYKNISQRAVVWVANREKPLADSAGVLRIVGDGNIALLDAEGSILWSSNMSANQRNTSAVLLDDGNLVLRDGEGSDVWQSFDYPTDTLLPGMKLQLDFRTGLGKSLVAWKDADDPSPGNYSYGFDPNSPAQLVTRDGSRILYRSGPWDGKQIIGEEYSNSGSLFVQSVKMNDQKITVSYTTTRLLVLSRIVLYSNGQLKISYWDYQAMNWTSILSRPWGPCDYYGRCGPFGICDSGGSPLCRCVEGFQPREMKDWARGDFTRGCVRRQPLKCDATDVFLRSTRMLLPSNFSILWNITAVQCEDKCKDDCQCSAYAHANIASERDVLGSRCLTWFGELVDLQDIVNAGENLYIRQVAAQLGTDSSVSMTSKKKILLGVLIPTFIVAALFIGILYYLHWRRQNVRMHKARKTTPLDEMRLSDTLGNEKDLCEVPLLDFNTLIAATNNFDPVNKLGQGGFGPVYKGTIQGQEIAVKRLSNNSGQGFQEFANEMKLIAKLQHTNLVRLLGWCSHEDEKTLIYEYMPNGSLDNIIFDQERSAELDWSMRFKIIEGIANGVLYLHRYSRLRIIHRDLKTSNILLDASMNPKISDFGLARIFGGDQTEVNTKRIAGTYGYMSPEYALDGLISEKSDVFSFGVILLEIVTGKRSTGYYPYKNSMNLLGYVWYMWKEGRGSELIGSTSMESTSCASEAMKCIHVGLLCIQDNAAERPTMSSVVLLLGKENASLPLPKEPAFAIGSPSPLPAIELSTTSKGDTQEIAISDTDECLKSSISLPWACCFSPSPLIPSCFLAAIALSWRRQVTIGNPISVNQAIISSTNSAGHSHVGIWYNSIPKKTMLWIANKEADQMSVLTVMADGSIAQVDGGGSPLWSSNLTGIPREHLGRAPGLREPCCPRRAGATTSGRAPTTPQTPCCHSTVTSASDPHNMAMVLLFLQTLSIYFLSISSSQWLCCVGEDMLLAGNPVSMNRNMTSSGGTFALGFFSPSNSSGNSYVGIWYNSIPEKAVVWVANREAPLTGPSGLLAIMADGNLAVLDSRGRILWSTNLTGIPAGPTSAVLLDSGNLVLRDGRQSDLWQSFDYPTDTYLPGQQLRLDFGTCKARNLVSWRDAQDPSPGKFSFGFDAKSPQQVVIKEGSRIRMRGWPWNAQQFNRGNLISQYVAVDQHGIRATYNTTGALELSRYVLDPSGDLVFLSWDSRASNWSLVVSMPRNPCEFYEPCGAFAYCEFAGASPLCKCLEGFEPKHGKSWATGDFSGGCARILPPAFDGRDAFLRAEAMKFPDNFAIRWNITDEQCRTECLGSWRCMAYASARLTGGRSVGSRCLVWSGDLIDLVRLVNEGQDLYVRVAASDLVRKHQANSKGTVFDEMKLSETLRSESDISELSLLDFNTIAFATNNFAIENKLGQGGFGPVYKGKLLHAHDVAIKRLSKCSGQGIEEFTNEVKLIAKLQHTNLVRLLAWCSHEEEKMLVYEYMPNGSLDKIIFDKNRSVELDWGRRLRIIEGIANGLLYLHQYSRLKVIHRDLKTSNILLDADMNPKISDFGLARIFGGNQTEANTDRVVEYAMDGLFSDKSDVFSFGVMVLEIITGKKTTGFYQYKESLNLLGYVWQLWKEGRGLEVVDPSAGGITSSEAEVIAKCIQVGLLCVQEDAADRPCMSSVVFMLRKENSSLPSPEQPAFAIKKNPQSSGSPDMSKPISFSVITTLVLLFALFSISNGGDTITRLQSIKDGQTLVSAGGSFVLGFFSPGNSISRYLGIWFAVSKEIVVWVANRDRPLNDSTGVLQIDSTGNLALTSKANVVLWTSRLPTAGSIGDTVAQLLETGNLVLIRNGSSGDAGASALWQSFDYPTDTMLPYMKLGPDYKAGRNRSLTSWRDVDDPAPGNFTYSLDTRGGLVQLVLYDQRALVRRSGPWNGLRFSGSPDMASYDMFNFTVVNNGEESYYEYGVTKPGIFARLMINSSGTAQRLVWDGTAWKTFWSGPKDDCDRYAWCGSYGLCDINNGPICGCLPGFQPKNPEQWYLRNWNAGCKRKTELNCSNGDGFKLVQQTKLPDTVNSTVNMSMSLKECEEMCLKTCSCTAYSSANISGGGSGCLMWTGDLVDIRVYTAYGQDLYLRLAASELVKIIIIVAIVAVVTLLLLLAAIGGCCLWRKKKGKQMRIEEGQRKQDIKNKSMRKDDPDLPLFDVDSIAAATNSFSDKNRIGKGGFGIVYKGMLDDGREVAVKRLSTHSGQGIDEFMTEVLLIARLQHRNLVRLLGCCIEGEERMLIYEYMPNGSLDAFIFGDRRSRRLLDWQKRLDIILGVARGLLYLHQDSRLRIIHRDLKAGNILLDGAMNPKISDFGTARIFGNDQMDENTVRIVGTIGYMSPEYAMDGNFSEKSDVFSFGVLILEIISGRKNRWISQKDFNLNLLAHAWRLWIEDRCLVLLDDTLQGPCPFSEFLKCIQVGLLCVQESAAERPTMQRVVLMLGNDNPTLPQPMKPGFFKPPNPSAVGSPSSGQEFCSINRVTVTGMEGDLHFIGASSTSEDHPLELGIVFACLTSSLLVLFYCWILSPGIFARLAINSSGSLQRLVWDGMAWKTFWSGPKDQCDRYAWCGSYGLCDTNNAPICGCLPGFQPKNPEQWYLRNWNAGCKRKTELNCSNGDGFKLVQQTKLPDTVNSTVNMSMSLKECEEMCLKNCSCTAYSSANISGGGSGCLMWTGDLVDIRVFTANGQDLYLRLAASELDAIARDVAKKKKTEIIIIVTVVIVLILFLVIGGCCLWRKKKRKLMRIEDGQRKQGIKNKSVRSTDDPELPIFDFDSTASATNFFSDKNRIGKGGFGIVYKGMLDDGREVAVKRLSMHSGQGIDEFMTEVMLIAKLQHRNLVRLLGCCIEGEERMLIYEYMPNGSLDAFIFDSRLRIIHRDLKAGNILLDGALNPKISDFGTARIFGNDQMDENTVRIVGTIGYMSPEYAMDGNFSEKSDVFSFGVLVLEIISGRKNRWISQKDLNQNLLARAWRLWIEDHCGELIDDTLRGPCPFSDVLKCIQVGLLCVQESAAERPTMQRVVLMLSSDNPSLPQPKKPGFFKPANPSAADSASSGQESCSINMITLTGMEGR